MCEGETEREGEREKSERCEIETYLTGNEERKMSEISSADSWKKEIIDLIEKKEMSNGRCRMRMEKRYIIVDQKAETCTRLAEEPRRN